MQPREPHPAPPRWGSTTVSVFRGARFTSSAGRGTLCSCLFPTYVNHLAPVGLGTTRLAAQDGDRGVETLCPAASEVRTGIPDASTVSASTGIVRVIGAHTVGLCCRAIGPCRRAHLGVSHRQRPVTRKERGGGEVTVEQAYRAAPPARPAESPCRSRCSCPGPRRRLRAAQPAQRSVSRDAPHPGVAP